jgi:glycosyltransferase 2 family protein
VNGTLEKLDSVGDRLATLDPRWLTLALLLQFANLGFRALAWRNVLAAAYPRERLRLLDVGAAYAAGVALNAYTPARGGEALKVALLRLRIPNSSVPTIASSSSVVLLFDALVGSALLVAAWSTGVVPALPHPSGETMLVVLAGMLLAGGLLAAAPGLRGRLRQGLAILATPKVYLGRVLPAQVGAWACRIGVSFALLAAFGLPATLPLAGLVVVAGGLSTLVPATPGGAGTQQLFIVVALQQVASASSALSFSIGMQVGVTIVNTLVGLAAMALLVGTLRPSAIRAAVRTRS